MVEAGTIGVNNLCHSQILTTTMDLTTVTATMQVLRTYDLITDQTFREAVAALEQLREMPPAQLEQELTRHRLYTLDEVRLAVRAELERSGTARAPEPLLDVAGVALWLHVSERTVERLVREGELVPVRIGSARRFSPAAVEAFLRRCPGGKVNRRRKRRR